jgi:hypothetical protein
MIIAESNADDDRGSFKPCEVRWSRLETFGIDRRRDDGFNLRKLAGDRLCEARKIAGCRNETEVLRPRAR